MSSAKLVPHLVCRNGSEAIAFYQRALGAEPLIVLNAPDGKLMHACLRVNGAEVFVCDECVEQGAVAPSGASPVTLHMNVGDCDAVYSQAIAAGCEARMPPQDMFWGDRYGVFVDPYGHSWAVATTIRVMNEQELRDAIAIACT